MTRRSLILFGVALAAMASAGTYEAQALRAAEGETRRLERLAGLTRQQIAAARQARRLIEGATETTAEVQAKIPFGPTTGDATFDAEAQELLRRVYALRKWFDQHPAESIPELRSAQDSDWFEAVLDFHPWNDAQLAAAAGSIRASAQMSFLRSVARALDQYMEEKGGNLPRNVDELAPYFSGPVDAAALARYVMVATGRMRDVPDGEFVMEERMTAEEREDANSMNFEHLRVRIRSLREGVPPSVAERAERKRASAIFEAIESYKRSHSDKSPTDAQQLRNYVKDPSVLDGIKLEEDGFSYEVPDERSEGPAGATRK